MKLTLDQFLARTLTPTERENWRTVDRQQKTSYRKYLERVSLYGDAELVGD